MTKTCVSLTTRFRGTRSDRNRLPATRRYRIRKSFPVVHFEQNGKGRIVFLPEGEELYVIGFSSHLREGFRGDLQEAALQHFPNRLVGTLVRSYRAERNPDHHSKYDRSSHPRDGSWRLTNVYYKELLGRNPLTR